VVRSWTGREYTILDLKCYIMRFEEVWLLEGGPLEALEVVVDWGRGPRRGERSESEERVGWIKDQGSFGPSLVV
jgi:hypothetical protein